MSIIIIGTQVVPNLYVVIYICHEKKKEEEFLTNIITHLSYYYSNIYVINMIFYKIPYIQLP